MTFCLLKAQLYSLRITEFSPKSLDPPCGIRHASHAHHRRKTTMKTKSPSRRLRPALLATICSFVALFSGRVHAQNLLQNGGFELGLTAGPGTYVQGLST